MEKRLRDRYYTVAASFVHPSLHEPMCFSLRPGRWTLTLALLLIPLGASAQEQDTTAAADSLLIQELEREMAGMEQDASPAPSQQAVPRGGLTTNPDISVIGDARGWYTSDGPRNVDAEMHEVEAAFRSTVDPYARADVYVAIAHEDGEFEFELEEAYLTTLALPLQLQLRAGKFRSTLGKINRIHPHALPFIDTPAVYENFFGHEGLNDQGASLSWLVPNPAFFQELTLEVTRGPGEGPLFTHDAGNMLLYTGHFKNFWDLSPDATLELGLTGIAGPSEGGSTAYVGGVDVTYRWKPVRFNTYRALTLQGEAFVSDREAEDGERVTAFGLYALANYQLARRWFLVGRYDMADLPADAAWNEHVASLTLGWYLTEFQKVELGGRRAWADAFDPVYEALVRLVFVIGTHGAHEY